MSFEKISCPHLKQDREGEMDICAIGDLFKEWSEPICACATLILSIAVIVINRKVDAESKRTREKDAMLLQPSGISAWLESPWPGNRVQKAWICNTTELPVYNVVATAVATKGGDCGMGGSMSRRRNL